MPQNNRRTSPWASFFRERVGHATRHCPNCGRRTHAVLSQSSQQLRVLIFIILAAAVWYTLRAEPEANVVDDQRTSLMPHPAGAKREPLTGQQLIDSLERMQERPPDYLTEMMRETQRRDAMSKLKERNSFQRQHPVLVIGILLIGSLCVRLVWFTTKYPRRWTCLICRQHTPASMLDPQPEATRKAGRPDSGTPAR